MRFFLFLLLSIHLCSTAYGQETNIYPCNDPNHTEKPLEDINICDRYSSHSSLPEDFKEDWDEFIACFDKQYPQDREAHISFMASRLLECSNDTQEYNDIILDTLGIYFTEPHMKSYILRFLEILSTNYEEVEAYNEEHNEWNRSVKNTAWAYVGLRALRWVIFKTSDPLLGRFRWLKSLSTLSMRRELAFSALAGTSTAVVSEMTEEDLSVRLDPSILSTSLTEVEMYDLQNSACELEEGLKTTEITNQERFDEMATTHENLRDSYALIAEKKSGVSITQELTLPKVINELWKKPSDPGETCLKNHEINLKNTACYLQGSARLLSDSPFSTQPIRFGSELIRCSDSLPLWSL